MLGHPSHVCNMLQGQDSTPAEQAAHPWTDWPQHPPAHHVHMRFGASAPPCGAHVRQYFADDIAHPFSRRNSLGLTWGGVMANLAASRRPLSSTASPCSPPALSASTSTDGRVEGKLARLMEEDDDDESLPCSSMDGCDDDDDDDDKVVEEIGLKVRESMSPSTRVSGTKRLRECYDVYAADDSAVWMLLRGFHSIPSTGHCSGPYHCFKRQTPDACETASDEMQLCA